MAAGRLGWFIGESAEVVLVVATQAQQAWVSCEIGKTMLWTILVILLVLWLLGVATSYTMGGLIHILLLVALAIFIINLIQGRRRSA
jgi:hypothetical protein